MNTRRISVGSGLAALAVGAWLLMGAVSVGPVTTTADYATNALATAGVWDLSKPYSTFATNANFALTMTGLPTSTDRGAVLVLSNNAASGAISATVPAGAIILTNGVPATKLWLTNLSAKGQVLIISVNCYGPGNTNGTATQFYGP